MIAKQKKAIKNSADTHWFGYKVLSHQLELYDFFNSAIIRECLLWNTHTRGKTDAYITLIRHVGLV